MKTRARRTAAGHMCPFYLKISKSPSLVRETCFILQSRLLFTAM